MKYKLKKETKPTLATYGKYKAVAIHPDTVGTTQIQEEVARRLGVSAGTVAAVTMGLSDVISDHLRRGNKVRLDTWGLMKLEIESDKVDAPADFEPARHIRGVRLHLLPESSGGKPHLYKDIAFEKEK